jgi:hypothetical protein
VKYIHIWFVIPTLVEILNSQAIKISTKVEMTVVCYTIGKCYNSDEPSKIDKSWTPEVLLERIKAEKAEQLKKAKLKGKKK